MRKTHLSIIVFIFCSITLSVLLGYAIAQRESWDFRVIWVKKRGDAQEILSQLKSGVPFWKLAREHSLYPNAVLGGYIEGARLGELREEFARALMELSPGEISKIIPLDGGYAILKREDASATRHKRERADKLYMKALNEAARGNFPEALKRAREILSIAPDHQAAIFLASASQRVLKGKIQPQYASELFEAILLFREGFTKKAAAKLQSLSKSQNPPPEVFIALGEVQLMLGNFRKATEIYSLALKFKRLHTLVNFFMGAAFLQMGEFRKAAEHYQKAVIGNPALAAAHVGLATALMSLGKIGKAMGELQTALAIDPQMDSAYDQMGLILLAAGRFQDAIWAFEKALAISPKNPSYLSHLGFAYNRMGMSSKAVQVLKKALSLAPNDPMIHNNLALAYFDNGETEKAIEHADKAKSLGYKVHPDFLAKLQPYRKSER